jgi:hypothetical protein
MAQRGWLVRPDHEVDTFDAENGYTPLGPVGAVSQQALGKAVMDGVIMLDRAGGVLSVTVSRATTGVPGERVTTGAMVEWKDRTDARPQPERDTPPVAPELVPAQAAQNGAAHAEAAPAEELPEIDESDVPAELRGL